MAIHDEARLDAKFTDFAKQMNLYLNHFPKHEKYGLAQQIRVQAYQCYGLIVEAQKRYHKKTTLVSLVSILGHLLTTLKDQYHDLFDRLPSRIRRHHHPLPALA